MKKISKEELQEKIFNGEDLSGFDYSHVTEMNNLFNGFKGETIPHIDTSNVTNMNYMFSKCENLKTIPHIDTSNATMMIGMFYYCTSLETIPEIDTSKVRTMDEMFFNCASLTHLPKIVLPKIENNNGKTNKVEDMFHGCEKLKLELSNWEYENPETFFKMFNYPREFLNAFSIQDTINLLHQAKRIDDFTKMTLMSSSKRTQVEHYLVNKLDEAIELVIPF